MRNKEIRTVVYAALFAAIASILKIYSLQLGAGWRISIFAIPIMLAGYFLGPIYGLAVGFVTDTVYMFISPYASIWSIYTISTMLWGLSGYLIKKFKPSLIVIILVILFSSLLETSINSVALVIEGGNDWIYVWTGLGKRLITLVIRLPFLIIVMKTLIQKLDMHEMNFAAVKKKEI